MPSDLETDIFRYQSLSGPDTIRLLVLDPGNHTDELQGTLQEVSLSSRPKYSAVSYTWGSPLPSCSLVCNGCHLAVTQSLSDCLGNLRKTQEYIIVWIDGVCINQRDLAERRHQVTLMAEIYRDAKEVLVWLGNDYNSHAPLAFDAMTRYLDTVQSRVGELSQGAQSWDYRDLPPFSPNGPSEDNEELLEAVVDILSRAWFSRVWTLQEVGLAAQATVICGTASTAFENIIAFAAVNAYTSYAFSKRYSGWGIRDAYDYIWATYEVPASWRDRMPFKYRKQCTKFTTFADILTACFARGATDKRDHIYSVLGHPSACIRGTSTTLVQPDYCISLDQLSDRLTRALVAKNQELTILSLVQHQDQDEIARAPSWVPELGHFPTAVIDHIVLGYGAGGHTPCDAQIEGETLTVSGRTVGELELTSAVLNKADFGYNADGVYTGAFTQAVCLLLQQLELETTRNRYSDVNCEVVLALVLCCRALNVPFNFSTQEASDQEAKRLARGFKAYLSLAGKTKSPNEGHFHPDVLHFAFWASRYCPRRFFRTKNGFWGLGPTAMRPGDRCCIFYGSRVPSVIRTIGDTARSQFVGECYVAGLMEGEVYKTEGLSESSISML
jgi:hypothetical protein